MISVFLGVILFFTKIRFPQIITNTLSSVGSMIGPLSMIVTGMLIAGVDLKKVFTNKKNLSGHIHKTYSRTSHRTTCNPTIQI